MSKLFEKTSIKGIELANRFVRSATWEGMATLEGAVTPKLVETMIALVKGGVGLIISGHTYVRPDGQASPWQLSIGKDKFVPGLREMNARIHERGGKIVVQLAHAGNFAPKELISQAPLAVSVFDGLADAPRREMKVQDIRDIINAFAEGAYRARSAGFDGVQLHSAHGYLLSQFLSPIFNKRQDEYGGNIRNRVRVHIEILKAIGKAVGKDYPVLIKMNCEDFAENGMVLEDSLQFARLLAGAGIDAIELSGGTLVSGRLSPSRMGINSEDKEAYFEPEARAFRKEISIPLILVGGMRSFGVAERIIEEGVADYISMSRPLIREPGLINRWKSGDLRKSECISDNRCFQPGREGEGIFCVTERREKKDAPPPVHP